MILTVMWEVNLCLIQNRKESRLDMCSYYVMMLRSIKILVWCSYVESLESVSGIMKYLFLCTWKLYFQRRVIAL